MRSLTILLIVSILLSFPVSSANQVDDIQGFSNNTVDPDSFDERLKKILPFGTYLGGDGDEIGNEILTDSNGNIYVVGSTTSSDFPVMNAYQSTNAGGEDMFVSSFTSAGVLRWSTYIGGMGQDAASDAVLDSQNNLYVIGYSESTNFPFLNAFQDKSGRATVFDVIVLSLTPDGQLRWSTCLAGTSNLPSKGISIDEHNDNIVITGWTYSDTFPTTMGPTLQGNIDIFTAMFNTTGYLSWSRLSGGTGLDFVNAVKFDSLGNIYLAGLTESNDIQMINPISTYNNGRDGYLVSLNSTGDERWSTYFGGYSSDEIVDLDIDSNDNIIYTGQTTSIDFPTLNALQERPAEQYGGGTYIVYLSITSAGILRYSSYFGGEGDNFAESITIDSQDNFHITGFIYVTPFQQGVKDFEFYKSYFTKYKTSNEEIFFSSFYNNGSLRASNIFGYSDDTLGLDGIDNALSITITSNDDVCLTGSTTSDNFWVNNGYNETKSDMTDAFISCILDPISDLDSDDIPNYYEASNGLQIDIYDRNGDLDTDGMPNYYEYLHGLKANVRDALSDLDEDGLTNIEEYKMGLLPDNNDTDGDNMPDGWEVLNNLDPFNNDADLDEDGDGMSNLYEFNIGSLANNTDSDADGMSDEYEYLNGLDPSLVDTDGDPDEDGLSNLLEFQKGTAANNNDTDGDNMPDGWEVQNNLDPLVDDAALDADGDGISNYDEYKNGTDPNISEVITSIETTASTTETDILDITPEQSQDAPVSFYTSFIVIMSSFVILVFLRKFR